ncbi:protein-disulfide reductase DsbD domain-containing protein [Aurantimonas coralicida]|uniref:protein-disulfide reductase DsbD domain-containing protein n=1 Tax=Aurantimonas coralicida TaxID=182270 RepID=UPI00238AEAA8|nr:protein-disulfide reductase DsbD domain-containing protein [Aurantimonas coralicida]MDE0921879.1 protein-disulfide reductase DsbD family protein [Aurantimonas coralicida]
MRWIARIAGGIAAMAMGAATAEAGPASTYASEQVTLHLVAGEAAPDGTVRGALLLDLAPGWHTYWLDPGASGIPPHIDFTATDNLAAADLKFPAPLRFGEGIARANGYENAVAIGYALTPRPGTTLDTVTASLAIGVCQDICIPVQAELAANAGDTAATETVVATFAALPARGGPLGRISSAVLPAGGDVLTVAVETVLDAQDADLFVRGPEGWYFDEPATPVRNGDSLEFRVPVVGRPRGATDGPATVDMVVTGARGDFAADAVPVTTDTPG